MCEWITKFTHLNDVFAFVYNPKAQSDYNAPYVDNVDDIYRKFNFSMRVMIPSFIKYTPFPTAL
jgi:hypothetical protein